MAAATYIYLDTAVSTTAYQSTTTAANAVGAGKVLIAKAQNGTGEATFQVFGGIGGTNIDASSIVANSITANELSTSLLYAGSLVIDTNGLVRSGQTAYDTGTGWWIGNDGGTPKLSIGKSTSTSYSTIAFDAVSNGGEDTTVSSSTHSHTCTGTNLTLLILVSVTDTTLSDRTVSSVTYNGVSATLVLANDNGDIRRTEIWKLASPATGANNIVVTMGGTCTALNVVGLSLTGTGAITTSGGQSTPGSGNSASTALTSTVANSWILGVLTSSNGGSSYTEGTNQTNRYTLAGTNLDTQVSTKPLLSPGATTLSWTWSGSSVYRTMTALIIQPATSLVYNGSMTWDGNSLSATDLTIKRTFIADEDLTAGATVGISNYSAGRIARAFRQSTSATLSFTAVENLSYGHRFAPIGGNKFVTALSQTSDDSLYLTVGSMNTSTKTLTLGTSLAVTADISGSIYAVCKLATDKFIVFYVEDASTTIVKYRVGTVSGTTISYGSAATFFTGGTAVNQISASFISTDKGVAVFKCATATGSRAVAFTVSSTTATAGTPIALGTNTDDDIGTMVRNISTDKFAIATLSGYVQIGTCVGGTTITLGTEVQFSAAVASDIIAFDITAPADNVIVLSWRNSSTNGLDMIAATIATRTPTFGSILATVIASTIGNCGIYAESESSILISQSNGSVGAIYKVTRSGTTLTSVGKIIQSANLVGADKIIDMDNGYYLTLYASSTDFQVWVQGMANQFLGILSATVSKEGTATVITSGKVGGQSGLISGSVYQVTSSGLVFANSNATMNTVDDVYLQAVSNTELLLK
jgi:hypothetical protein